jgi:hypothetical protein
MAIQRFDPPALLQDLDAIPGQYDGWSKYMSATIDDGIAAVEEEVGAGKSWFRNELRDAPQVFADDPIIWDAFPRVLLRQLGRQRALRVADDLAPDPRLNVPSRIQDEYCEWRVERDNGRIVRIIFTCEAPEYWQSIAGGPSIYDPAGSAPADFGAKGDRSVLVRLYREILGNNSVQEQDLFFPDRPDTYNPWNHWNTTSGIVHLQQLNNTLGAEVRIGADASVRRRKGGVEITDPTQLICCGGFGVVERSSDPGIGREVNKKIREMFAVTLRNPVAIYFHSFDPDGITKPGPGNTRLPAGSYWTSVRGRFASAKQLADGDMVVRAVYEVPAGETTPDGRQLTISDLEIGGEPVEFGGQIAERIRMKFYARAWSAGTAPNPPRECGAKCCRQDGILQVVRLNASCPDVFPASATPTFAGVMAARGATVSSRRRMTDL